MALNRYNDRVQSSDNFILKPSKARLNPSTAITPLYKGPQKSVTNYVTGDNNL